MTTHVGILPIDVLHTLCAALQPEQHAQRNVAAGGLPFLRLPHPRTGVPTLFLPFDAPSTSSSASIKDVIVEVQAVAPLDPRSWFIGEEVVADGNLLVMTPVDPAFLLIPILQAAHPQDGTLGTFRPADDIFEEASRKLQPSLQSNLNETESSVLNNDILRFASMKVVKESLKRICDVKEITSDIVVYRLSLQKVVEYLRLKVARLATPEVLEVSRTLTRGLAKDGLMEDGKESLLNMGRIRAACDLLAQYLSPTTLAALLASYDFADLENYLKRMEVEVTAITTTVKQGKGRKVGSTEEDKKRKTKGSQGVEKLKKVNVNGMSGAKQYVDRATQTEAQESLSGLVLGPSVSAERPSNTAYTHWPSLTTLSEESSSLSPSASTPHRISKPPQLLYNRPVEPHALAKRIVSLPESSSCDSLRRTVHDVAGIRIVSLPEPIRCSPQSRDSSSYLDSFGTSADPSLASLGSDFGHLKFRSYPRDVPRTPSPPSSPSSILIIDNEVHLPSYQQHKNSVTEHDGGWITWASSPPRPIPALHGPSSLPYARCPSGAEGIIIEEDADLPRMVWGLTLEGLPSSDTRKQRTINVHKPTTVNFQSTLQAARQIPQVQLSSAIYSPNSEICLPASRHNYSADAVLRRSPALEGVNRSTSRDSAIQFLGPPLDQHHMHNMQENRAVNWREPSYISASKIKTINERPSSLSASIFVPAASKHGCPRTTTEFCAPTLVKPRTLAAIDIARQYCLDQQKNTLPTPPTSSSPQWSPVLPGHAPFSQLREERNFLDDQQASELSPARTRSGIDPLEEQQLVGSPPAGRGLGLRDVPPPLSSWTRRYSPSNQFPQKSCKTTLSSGPPPSTSLYPSNIHRTADLTSTGTSDPHPPLERRVSVSRTHPKQWRLPSVVEEDSGTGLNNVSLCVQSRPHVYAALRGTSRRTTHISDSDHPFTGFDDFSPTAADIAKVAFDPNSGPQFETPCITLAQNIKPAMESTPTVKLPLSTAFLGRQDEVGVREAKGTRFDNEKENTSNVKTRDKSVLKRGRARKRNMNTKLDDSQNKMPK